MRVNTNNQATWIQWDTDTVRNTEGGVNHGASAAQNLRSMGEDVMHAALPVDRAISYAVALSEWGGPAGAFIGFLAGIMLDFLEIIALPFMLLWNAGNIVAHGVGAAINGVHGESDGEAVADDQPGFNFLSLPSVIAQAQGYNRGNASSSNVSTSTTSGALSAPSTAGVSVRA